MAHVPVTIGTSSGWYIYTDSITCQAAQTQFLGLSPAGRLAALTVEPQLPAGKVTADRLCGETYASIDSDVFFETVPATPPVVTTGDPGAEQNVTFYQSNSNDDGGTI